MGQILINIFQVSSTAKIPPGRLVGRVFLVADTSLIICILVLPILYNGRGINLHVQHTPNPEAQDPPLVPPLFEHSSLKKFKRI